MLVVNQITILQPYYVITLPTTNDSFQITTQTLFLERRYVCVQIVQHVQYQHLSHNMVHTNRN